MVVRRHVSRAWVHRLLHPPPLRPLLGWRNRHRHRLQNVAPLLQDRLRRRVYGTSRKDLASLLGGSEKSKYEHG